MKETKVMQIAMSLFLKAPHLLNLLMSNKLIATKQYHPYFSDNIVNLNFIGLKFCLYLICKICFASWLYTGYKEKDLVVKRDEDLDLPTKCLCDLKQVPSPLWALVSLLASESDGPYGVYRIIP